MESEIGRFAEFAFELADDFVVHSGSMVVILALEVETLLTV